MLAVVLVVEHHLHLAQAGFQARAVLGGFDSRLAGIPCPRNRAGIGLGAGPEGRAVTPGAPLQKGLTEIGAALPVA